MNNVERSRVEEQFDDAKENILNNSDFPSYLNDSGNKFYEKDMFNNALKSFLLSYDVTKDSKCLLNIIEMMVNNKIFDTAEKLCKIYQARNLDDFEFYDYAKQVSRGKSLWKSPIDENFVRQFDLPTISFLHIPKTAGLTLLYILNQLYPLARIHFHIGEVGYIKQFIEKDAVTRNSYDVIPGHLLFGVHKYIDRKVVYFTMLREPIVRTVSEYYFILRKKPNFTGDYIIENKIGLKEYVLTKCHGYNTYLDNCQVQYLAGTAAKAGERVTKSMLELAKKNLRESMAVVGIQEQFDESMLILKKKFGWTMDPFYLKQNSAKSNPKLSEIDEDTMKVLIENNQYDIELYNYAMELFAEHKKEYGENLKRDVNEFRYFNNIYQGLLS